MLGEDLNVIFLIIDYIYFFQKSYYKVITGCKTHFHSVICLGLTEGVYLLDIKTVFNCRGWVILTYVLTNLETHEPLKYCVVTNLNKDQDAS